MEKSKVFNALVVLSKKERRQLELFLQTPYFSPYEEIVFLYKIFNNCIEKEIDVPSKEIIYKQLHGRQEYDDQRFRLYMSSLFKAIEKFYIVEQVEENTFLQKQKLLEAYNKHNHHKNFLKTYQDAAKELAETPYRTAEYYEYYYKIETERYNENRNLSRTEDYNFQLLSSNFELYFIIEKLKQACILASHEEVSQLKYDYGLFDITLKYIEDRNLLTEPAIAAYYYIYHTLKHPNQQENFERLQEIIRTKLSVFPKAEARDILINANNYCIKMNNTGIDGYLKKLFEINKIGIASGVFLENGFLSRFTYKNIVTSGVRLKEYEWTEGFIEQYKNLLEDKYRESSYSYNRAVLEYDRKNYSETIVLLQKADYDDVLLNLAAKNILLKTYFEMDYIESLEYLIGSILMFLKRKKLEQVYQNNYQNIALLTRRLITLKNLTGSQKKILEKRKTITKKIISETACTEKKWLLEQLEKIN